MRKFLPLLISLLLIFTSATVLTAAANASSPAQSGQAIDIEQGNVYTYAKLFSTGFSGSAYIQSGNGLIQYTANLSAPSTSISEIGITSAAGQILSSAKGTGYYVRDSFNFSFSGQTEYIMYLFYSLTSTSPSTSIATTSSGILAESSNNYVYALSTNNQYAGTVFTATQNVTSTYLQATIYIFQQGSHPPPSSGTIHFVESGLATGSSWSVVYHSVLNGYTGANSTLSSIDPYINLTAALGNVIYYWITDSSGLTASPHEGILSLSGNVTIDVLFPSPAPSSYSVTFIPQGIPSGVTWGVGLNGLWQYNTNLNGQDPDIVFSEASGTYSYSVYVPSPYSVTPSSGTITIASAAISQNIQFITPTRDYTITFSETGLPSGTVYTVSIGAVSSGNPTAQFTEPNGTYYFTISGVQYNGSTYVPSPNSGKVVVSGGNQEVAISFTSKTYKVVFTESGLAPGTLWGVSLSGKNQTSSGTSITFSSIIPGTYAYTATASGYASVSGALLINSSSPSTLYQPVSFVSDLEVAGPPSVSISSSQNFHINGSISSPSGYTSSDWSALSVLASSTGYSNTFSFSPVEWNFSLQVPRNNVSYSLSLRLLGNNLQSQYYNTTVVVTVTSVNGTSAFVPSYYSISPASGSVIYSSTSIRLFLKGNVTYSGQLTYSSAYGESSPISVNSTTLSNGTEVLSYALNINIFPSAQYTFKFSAIYRGSVESSFSAQYTINGPSSITLKYSYTYQKELNGNYNVSFNVSVVDNISISYSPVNVIQVSSASNNNGQFVEIGYVSGRHYAPDGVTRYYFTFSIENISKGSYTLQVGTYNKSGNALEPLFSSNYTYQVPKIVNNTNSSGWETVTNWFRQGYNGIVIAGLGVVVVIGSAVAWTSGKPRAGKVQGRKRK